MAAGWKDDWYPQSPIGTGFGAWFGTLTVLWILVFAIGDAIGGWGAIVFWPVLACCFAWSAGIGFDQWETRRIADKLRLPETPKAGRRPPEGKHRPNRS